MRRTRPDWSALLLKATAIEARGATIARLDAGRFRVDPPAALTSDDVVFLRQHRDSVREVVAYCEPGVDGVSLAEGKDRAVEDLLENQEAEAWQLP
jgi:hypothetical protein